MGCALLGPGCPKEAETASNGSNYDVVIIGGGISGLTLAYLLRNENILLLEKEHVAGGRIISGQWEGFHYPKGCEYTGEPEGDVATLLNQLGLNAIQVPPPTDAVAYEGTIYYGETILRYLDREGREDYWDLQDELTWLNDHGVEEAVFEYPEDLADYAYLDSQSVGEWLQANDYDSLVQLFVNVENRALFGANNQDLSFLFNIPEMAYDLPDRSDAYHSEVYTFSNGMIEVVDTLVGLLSGKMETGAEVSQVRVNGDESVSVTYHQDGETNVVRASKVVLTTPAPITASIVSNGFSQAVRQALESISYSTYVTLNLFTSERLWKDAWTMACLDTFFLTIYDAIRTQVPTDYDEKGILGIFIAPESAGDSSLLAMSDAEILENTLAALERYFPSIRSKVLGHDIQRFIYAFPVFAENYHQILRVLQTDPTIQGPLFLAGDYMVYATFDGAIISAFRAYDQVTDYVPFCPDFVDPPGVGMEDIMLVASRWHCRSGDDCYDERFDPDHDDDIDIVDIMKVAVRWGETCECGVEATHLSVQT